METSAFQIPLSSNILQMDAFDFCKSQPDGFCDHIVTDPDQASPSDFQKLLDFLPVAFRAITTKGFFGFWLPITQFEFYKKACISVGFEVQPYPLIWSRQDRITVPNSMCRIWSTPSYESLLLCHKPGSILAKRMAQSDYRTGSRLAIQRYGSPYAKPIGVTRWIFWGIAKQDQIVYDPFAGCGTGVISAIDHKLCPIATESNPSQYDLMVKNVQNHLRKKLGDNVIFI